MSGRQRAERWVRRAAFVAGLGLAAAAVLAWRTPSATENVGLDLTLVANLTGELGVAPVGAVLHRRGMQPSTAGGGARGEVRLTNQTPSALAVRVRIDSSDRNLDRLVRVEIRAGGKRLARGTLSALRRWSPRSLRLAPREQRRIGLRVWLLPSRQHAYAGSVLNAELKFRSRPLETLGRGR